MSRHTMVLSEPVKSRPGFIQRYYANIEISKHSTGWFWIQLDANENYIGATSPIYPSEEEAMNNALKTLKGDKWE